VKLFRIVKSAAGRRQFSEQGITTDREGEYAGKW
jgi:hypothetical protein